MARRFLLLLLMVVLGAWSVLPRTAFPQSADKEQPTAANLRFVGGIIDSVGNTAYLRHKADAIQAVDLRTGEVRWESQAAFLPLAADSKRVAALALGKDKDKGGPAVVFLDPKGKVLKQSEPLPGGVWFGEGPTTSSSVTARFESGKLNVRWSSHKRPFSGVPQIAMQRTLAFGEAQVDPETGKVKILRDEVILPEKKGPVPPPQEAEPDLKLPAELVKELDALHTKGCWPRSTKDSKPRPLVVGNKFVLVVFENTPAGRKFVLTSWDRDTGKPRPPVTLVEGKELHVISACGEFLFVQDIAPPTPIEQRPTWVFSLDSGKEIAKLNYAQAMSPLCVLGDRLLRVTGSASEGVLEAVDLRTGKSAWSRTFYRYHYSGPFPPSAPKK
jgi:hypothetical protein